MSRPTNTSNPETKKADSQRLSGAGESFPPDVAQQPNYFAITLRPYSVGANINPSGGGGVAGPGGKKFFLPMPVAGLRDSFNVEIEKKKMGVVGGVGSSIVDAINNPSSIVGNAMSALGAFGRTLGEEAMGAALGDAGVDATQLATGAINNPNLAALFKGVQLRQHSFTWRMIAYNQSESAKIDSMVTQLKQSALPTRTSGGNFGLNYPDIAYLQVVGPKENGLITFSRKGAFIENITVDYMGQTHPAFFTGSNSPVEVTLSMSFLERSIITSKDVGG
jgi:hypothetical protein